MVLRVLLVGAVIGAGAGAAGALAQSLVDRERGIDGRFVAVSAAGGAASGMAFAGLSLLLERETETET